MPGKERRKFHLHAFGCENADAAELLLRLVSKQCTEAHTFSKLDKITKETQLTASADAKGADTTPSPSALDDGILFDAMKQTKPVISTVRSNFAIVHFDL